MCRLRRSRAITWRSCTFSCRDKPYQANRVLEIQSKIFNLAEVWGWRGEKGNPCRHVRKYMESKRERFLSDEEFRRLGEVVNEMEAKGLVSVYEAGGHSVADAHRLPEERDRQAEVEGCGHRRG